MTVKASPGLPRGAEVMAACAVLVVVIQLVFTPLTLALAVLFTVAGRVTRWHPSWLLAPAAVGLAWGLAAGPGHVIAGFAAGPAQVLRYFGHGSLLGRLSHPLPGVAAAQAWLPAQLAVTLPVSAVETAVLGWLHRHRAGQPALPGRPGAVAVLRGALAARNIRAGAVLTRNGCALGVVRATGAVAELRWAEIADGAVVTGAAGMDVTVACLQVAHAALRRRKPLIVLDTGNDAAIARVLGAACAATVTPLRRCSGGTASVTSWLEGAPPAGPSAAHAGAGAARAGSAGAGPQAARSDLLRVVSERTALLLHAGSPQLADQACADLAALAAELRRIGVDGDGLIWVTAGESLPPQALAALIHHCGAAGLPVLVGVTSTAASTALAASGCSALTLAPRRPRPGRPRQFSLIVEAPRRRQTGLAYLVPSRLPSPEPGALPRTVPARTRAMSARPPHGAASPGGRP